MRWTPPDVRITYERVNTVPGFVFWRADGTAAQAGACELTESSRIAALYLVRNPEKLRHLGKTSSAHLRVIGELSRASAPARAQNTQILEDEWGPALEQRATKSPTASHHVPKYAVGVEIDGNSGDRHSIGQHLQRA
jgi:hypothetical protein